MVRTKSTRKKNSLRGGNSGLTLSHDSNGNLQVCTSVKNDGKTSYEAFTTARSELSKKVDPSLSATSAQQETDVPETATATTDPTQDAETQEDETAKEKAASKIQAVQRGEQVRRTLKEQDLQKQLEEKRKQLDVLKTPLGTGGVRPPAVALTQEKLENEIGDLEKQINALKGSKQRGGRRRKSRRKPRKSKQVKRTKRSIKSFKKPKKNNKKTKRR